MAGYLAEPAHTKGRGKSAKGIGPKGGGESKGKGKGIDNKGKDKGKGAHARSPGGTDSIDRMIVTVTGMDGSDLLGPEPLPKDMPIAELRTRLLSPHPGYHVGEHVEMKDEDGNGHWFEGTVSSLQPLECCADGARRSREWGKVRKPIDLSRPCDVALLVGTRSLQDYDVLQDAANEDDCAEVLAVFSSVTLAQRNKCKRAIAQLRCDWTKRNNEWSDSAESDEEDTSWLEGAVTKMFGKFSEADIADREVMAEALAQLGTPTYKFVPASLKADGTFMVSLVRRGLRAHAMILADDSLKSNTKFAKEVPAHFSGAFLSSTPLSASVSLQPIVATPLPLSSGELQQECKQQ